MAARRRRLVALSGLATLAATAALLSAAPVGQAAADGGTEPKVRVTVTPPDGVATIDRLPARTRKPVPGSIIQTWTRERFTKETCVKAIEETGAGVVTHSNRFSTCRMVGIRSELLNDPTVWAETKAVFVSNTDQFHRTVATHLWTTGSKMFVAPGSDPQGTKLRKVMDTDLQILQECWGMEGASCDDKKPTDPGPVPTKPFDGGPRNFVDWYTKESAREPSTVTFQTDRSDASKLTSTMIAEYPEIAQQQDIDKVSYHTMATKIVWVDGLSRDFAADDTFRCDNAKYLRARHGCVWRRTVEVNGESGPIGKADIEATYPAPYSMAPEWAQHVLKAQNKPTQTQPYAPDPNQPGAPRDPFGWGGTFNIAGGPSRPSADLPLTRIYQGSHNRRTTQGQHAAAQANANRNMVRRACNHLNRTPPGVTTPECDEYPFASTWQGAQYTNDAATKAKPWKFSVKYIGHRANNDAGRDLRLFYSWAHVLHGGDPFRVAVLDAPASRAGHEEAVREFAQRKDAQAQRGTRAPRAFAPEDLCTNPDIPGGFEFVCDYDEEWVKFDNGTFQAFVIGKDGQAYTNWTRSDGSWAGWQNFGGWHDGGIEVVDHSGGYVKVRTTGTDGQPYYKERTAATGAWSEWHK
ncbi:hypothetical protein [Streptomyces longispororuber]|uniref:NucA/NucB deoxyribonuclease domain-containing protein n=1 Tax=Streptomyces longispororuber TaxID=68230 RepID=UPI0036FE805D